MRKSTKDGLVGFGMGVLTMSLVVWVWQNESLASGVFAGFVALNLLLIWFAIGKATIGLTELGKSLDLFLEAFQSSRKDT